jgi:hypothetical protein
VVVRKSRKVSVTSRSQSESLCPGSLILTTMSSHLLCCVVCKSRCVHKISVRVCVCKSGVRIGRHDKGMVDKS